jgi:hypothetical protein
MLVNQKNGSYGMFSRAGRISTEKFNILIKKDEILNGTGKKFKPPDLFAHAKDEAMKHHLENQDEIQQIFLDEIIEEKNKEKDRKKHEKIYSSHKSDADMQKFLDIRNKTKRMNQIPCCTKYDPKNTYIWKKPKQIPGWETTVGKNKSIKKEEEIAPLFYKTTKFEFKGKNFIDLDRQLARKPFVKTETEYQYTKKNYNNNSNNHSNYNYSNKDRDDKSQNLNFSTSQKNFHSIDRKGLKSAIGSVRARSSRTKLNINETEETNNKFNRTDNQFYDDTGSKNSISKKEITTIQRSFSSKFRKIKGYKSGNLRNSRSANPLNSRKWFNNPAPDFKKVISRETRDRMYDDKKRVIPFSIPPYQKTRPSI